MDMILICLILYSYIIFFDLVPIKQNNYNNLFRFNLTLMCFSFLIVILVALDLKVPNPSNLIEYIVNIFVY